MSEVLGSGGGGGGGGCFPAGTRIATPDGDVAIESLKVGDIVLSFDASGRVSGSTVQRLHVHNENGGEDVHRIKFWGGSFKTTLNHWVQNQYNTFAMAGTMTEHDALIDGLGHMRPFLSSEFVGRKTVYNLTVLPDHTFIADNIRVHNGGRGATRPVIGTGGGGEGGGKGGGGGSSARVAVEDPDSLQSHQYVKIIDLVSEGEIEGLIGGLKSIYLDGVPIQNNDNTMNFAGITAAWRTGTQNQEHIPGFSDVESEVYVNVEVQHAIPVIRSIANSTVDAVRVTLGFPQLTEQNTTTGDVHGSSVNINISLQTNGGGYSVVKNDTVSGKTTSHYRRSYLIRLPGDGPWDIKVTRVTADSTVGAVQNTSLWDSYTEIIESKLSYPNSALVGIQVDAAQFRSIPTRGYRIKGVKCQVPTNYDPVAHTYTELWDGSFKMAWTDNPAWVFYDLLTEARYGLGAYVNAADVDKWALYDIGKYCDQLVPDGFGGEERRFSCNLYLQTQEDAYKVMNNLASIFRGMIFWSVGQVTTICDKPSDPIYQFTNANVIDGMFSYSGSSRTARHTVALVTWNDPAEMYRQKVEYVEDIDGIIRYGVNQTEVVAIGCTSRGQAHRLGRWILYTERMETEIVTFSTGMDGVSVYPGAVINVADVTRSGDRIGGRIISATANTVTLDAAVVIAPGLSYTLTLIKPDGTLVDKAVTNVPGTVATLGLSSSFDVIPQEMSIWVLASTNLVPQTFRVISVSEKEGGNIDVSALEHNVSKFAAVENQLALVEPPTSSILWRAETPTNGVVVESEYLVTPGNVGIKLHVSWSGVTPEYEVAWKRTGDSVANTTYASTPTPSIDIANVIAGTYEFSVVAVSALNTRSRPLTFSFTTGAAVEPPIAVTSLFAIGGLFLNTVSWGLPVARNHSQFTEIWASTTNNRVGATRLTSEPWPGNTFSHTGLNPGVTWFYWARIKDFAESIGPWYPDSATAGISAASITDPSSLLALLNNSIGLDQITADLRTPIESVVLDSERNAGAVIASILNAENTHRVVREDLAPVVAASEVTLNQVATDLAAEVTQRETLAVSVGTQITAAISAEATIRATADSAMAGQITTLIAGVGSGSEAAIAYEAQVRADADSAMATSISTTEARLNSGDFAAVKTESSASASAVTGLSASYVIKAQANGVMASMSLGSNSATGSSVVFSTDKFIIAQPDGSGMVPAFTVGNLAGVPAVGINGNLIVDGTITGERIHAETRITSGTGNSVAVMDGSDANYRFWAGNASPSLAPFSVNKNGNVSIKSGSSGERLEIINNSIRVYDGNGVARVIIGSLS